MLTARTAIAANLIVVAHCAPCRTVSYLSLHWMVASGRGDLDIGETFHAGKIRCDRCGTATLSMVVEHVAPGSQMHTPEYRLERMAT